MGLTGGDTQVNNRGVLHRGNLVARKTRNPSKTWMLTLTDVDGTVIQEWQVSADPRSETADIVVPVVRMGVQDLADQLNAAVGL